jgi:hypothetical protein
MVTPDIQPIEWLVRAEMAARKIDQRRIEIDRVDHLLNGAAFLDMSGPACQGNDPGAAFIERILTVSIWPVVGGKHDL